MSAVEDAVYEAITGESRSGEPSSLLGQLTDIRENAGSWKATAELIGVTDSTLRKWRRGQTGGKGIKSPGAKSRNAIRGAVRRARLSDRREQYLRGRLAAGARLDATVKVSDDERPRTIDLSVDITQGALGPMVDAFLRGDDEAAADAFQQAIAEDYFGLDGDTDAFIIDVDDLDFGGPD